MTRSLLALAVLAAIPACGGEPSPADFVAPCRDIVGVGREDHEVDFPLDLWRLSSGYYTRLGDGDTKYALSPDRGRIALLQTHALEIRDLRNGGRDVIPIERAIYSLDWSGMYPTLTGDARVYVIDTIAKQALRVDVEAYRAKLSPDGAHIAATGRDGRIRIADTGTRAVADVGIGSDVLAWEDSEHVLLASRWGDETELVRTSISGQRTVLRTLATTEPIVASADGARVAYTADGLMISTVAGADDAVRIADGGTPLSWTLDDELVWSGGHFDTWIGDAGYQQVLVPGWTSADVIACR